MTTSHGINATTPAPMVVYSLADWTQRVSESCVTYLGHVMVETGCISESNCTNHGWDLTGEACNVRSVTRAVPDVFFLSWLLALGTLGMAISLKNFRNSPFFPSFVRTTVSDFAVFLAIVTFTVLDFYFRLDTPKLLVPNEVKTTLPDRGWLVNPAGISKPYIFIPLAIIPAALAVILIFLDHQITCVIINRAEHKLKKGGGYHLDLFAVSILVLVCSVLGLPWFVAATVRSLNHVRSLMKESEVRIPGEKPQFIGVREQRVTGITIHVLIGLSALLTSVLQLVPMPVLYGVFLYMGISSLAGVQFIQRILLMFMPSKFQPDYAYLRHVKLTRVHIFTLLQILCMAGMWIVKSIKAISIGFPIMVLALCVMRKAMDYIFTQHELFWLDHLLPEQERRKKEDEEELEDKQTTWEADDAPAAEYEYKGGARKKSMDIINRRISHDH